jgi:hypothetical protein
MPDPAAARPRAVLAANLGLRFALELAMLAALAYWGFRTGSSVVADVVLGLGAPALAALVWGVWAAPRSPRRLHGGALLALQSSVFAVAAVALAAAGRTGLAIVFAVVVAANTVVLRLFGEDGSGAQL